MHIRYFFTKDTIARDDMKVQHCPANAIIADFYVTIRQQIMGVSLMLVEEYVWAKNRINQSKSST